MYFDWCCHMEHIPQIFVVHMVHQHRIGGPLSCQWRYEFGDKFGDEFVIKFGDKFSDHQIW